MTYNLDLEKRLEKLSEPMGKFIRKVMFGGVGYMLEGNMAFGVHKQALLIRTTPEMAERLLKRDNVSVFDLTGRPMKGWLLISPEGVKSEKQLAEYLKLAVDFARSLPSK
jgi:hypothetical protein